MRSKLHVNLPAQRHCRWILGHFTKTRSVAQWRDAEFVAKRRSLPSPPFVA